MAKESHEAEFQMLAVGWWTGLSGDGKAEAIGLYAI